MQSTIGTPTAEPTAESAPSRFNLTRIVIIAAAVLIGLVILIFVLALLLAINNIDQTSQVVRIIRDMMIIFLALEGILIVLGLAVLILQIASLINVLQTEIKPILENTQETVRTAQSTVTFVSKNVAGPITTAGGFMAGTSVVLGNLFGIRRALTPASKREVPHEK
jgi:hypothetical protein